MSDAVDATIAKIDFRPLAGQRIFLDTAYLTSSRTVPGVPNPMLGPNNLINADYVVSSVRQQMIAAGCLIEEKKEEADLIAEVRIGALGTDGHSVTYGLPANNLLNSASSIVPGSASVPTIPEISIAKKELKSGAAKVAVFAYSRETHQAVWQSGIEQSSSNSRDTWVLGIGPIQQGSIYKSARFAGGKIYDSKADDRLVEDHEEGISIRQRHLFANALEQLKGDQPTASNGTQEPFQGANAKSASPPFANTSSAPGNPPAAAAAPAIAPMPAPPAASPAGLVVPAAASEPPRK